MNNDNISLKVLGSGTGIPEKGRYSSSFFLSYGCFTVLMDCGPGAVKSMSEAGVDMASLNMILISHFHPDHCHDLGYLLFLLRHFYKRDKDLLLLGPEGINDFYMRTLALYNGTVDPEEYRIIVRSVTGRYSSESISITPYILKHPGPSLGYLLNAGGKGIAFSGDTGFCEELVRMCSLADLAVLECSLPDGMAGEDHMSPSDISRVISGSKCGHVLLTHIYPALDREDIIREFIGTKDVSVSVAEEGMDIIIQP